MSSSEEFMKWLKVFSRMVVLIFGISVRIVSVVLLKLIRVVRVRIRL